MSDSRLAGLYRMTLGERIEELHARGYLSADDAGMLQQGLQVLAPDAANRIIENVIGVFGLPLAVAPNFLVNGRDYVVPMVVEEPSIVAATSNAARQARASGGFSSSCEESLLAGQVHLRGMADVDSALAALDAARAQLLTEANAVHPGLVRRGGGTRDMELRTLRLDDGTAVIAVHLLVDTCDAMGANLVNTVCESLAPRLAAIAGGAVVLRILSNLAERSLVRSSVCYRLADLAVPGFEPEAVRDGIVAASAIAAADPYRAVTHNKGIMNGVDALALATANDWRAIEAGAHAFAARNGRYEPLATWHARADGDLAGDICLPLKVATVGGTLHANPAAGLALRMTGVASARELAELMAAVGLAQNFAAIRALATRGIQEGHMRLHARSRAPRPAQPRNSTHSAGDVSRSAGKLILMGEHAAVYGKHALALPIPDAVSASIATGREQTTVTIAGPEAPALPAAPESLLASAIELILRELGLEDQGFAITVQSRLPRAMGLGSSAAIAVAIVRAFAARFELDIDDARVNAIAFACEGLAHGTPSGVDNTIATYAVPMLFRNAGSFEVQQIELGEEPPVVIACGHRPGSTKAQVDAVRLRRERSRVHFDAVFDEIDALSLAAAAALAAGNYAELGALMNIGHGLLNAIGVSTAELERMVEIARAAGAAGAKLTGSGGGGSVVAICPGTEAAVAAAFAAAGYTTLPLQDAGKQSA